MRTVLLLPLATAFVTPRRRIPALQRGQPLDKLEATEMTQEQRRRVVAAGGGNAQYHRSPAKGRS